MRLIDIEAPYKVEIELDGCELWKRRKGKNVYVVFRVDAFSERGAAEGENINAYSKL